MLGATTPSANINSRVIDLTRLISRVGRGPMTGVDRVEMAYLLHLLNDDLTFFVFVRTALGYLLLDRTGASQIEQRLQGHMDWGKADVIGRLSFKASAAKRRAEADLRRFSIARCRRGKLPQMLAQTLPKHTAYLNVGHSNLTGEVLRAWKATGTKISVLIHDTIPLDHPELQRPGTPAKFEEKLRRVGQYADLVICNSRQTQNDVTRWFGQWGMAANTLVAHLGLDLPEVVPDQMPSTIDTTKPFFVTLGTIEPRKNHRLLLDVWDTLANELDQRDMPNLHILGARGWENEDVFHRLDTSPLIGKHVFEHAKLSDNAVHSLLQNASAVLFPSFAEGYGLPPAEAVALGTPVICSDLAVFRETLGNIPVYLKPDDVYSWKQSIIGSAKQKRAGQQETSVYSSDFKLPTWAEHFNIVLRQT